MKRLVALPMKKSFEIAFKSLRIRFFRSIITIISLVLAVSFLTFTHVSDDIAQSMLALPDTKMQSKLIKMGYDISFGDVNITASAKQRWIVFLSLLVCIVGIINAQLMSVTERFQEIGTMKCLGALDKFVVRIFIIEAAFQGLAGSAVGALLGAIAAIFMGIIHFGKLSITSLPLSEIGYSSIIAVLIGTSLSLIGVLYPALLAARMQPVEAMRAEH